MNLFASLISLLLSIILLVVGITLAKPRSEKQGVASADKRKRQASKGSKVWILYLAVALLLAFKTIWGALFFLVIVWLLRRNPDRYSKYIPYPTHKEKRAAQLLYIWLMLSSFLTVPVFSFLVLDLSSESSTNERTLAALIPAISHVLLLLGFSSTSAFVFRHTQQAILLIAIRAALAALTVSMTPRPDDGLEWFFGANGVVWLVGNFGGWDQVRWGTCLLMKLKGETILPKEKSVGILATAPEAEPSLETLPKAKLSAEEYMQYSQWYLNHAQQDRAKEYALEAFRLGNFETKGRAIRVLDRMGEVEFF